MTPKITLIILQTLCGKIAKDQNDDLTWSSSLDKKNYRTLTTEIGTVILGSNTFKAMPDYAFKNRKTLVLSSEPEKYENKTDHDIVFLKGEPLKVLEYLKENNIAHAALVGGGRVNSAFLKENCVDEIFTTLAPKIFGSGVPGFGEEDMNINLELLDFSKLGPSELLLHYKVVK